ncbi:MAG TPA: hypothetical protein VHH73_10925 [Verrucomicrobiae bacterium]|nr:hypothetical protein [Verrucomicrobiae bacterium]
MNFDEMRDIWNAPGNDLSANRQRSLAGQFSRQMLRRRRFQTVWLVCLIAALTVTTGIAIRAVALGRADLESGWGLFPLLIVPWLFALHFLRRHLNPARPVVHGELPLAEVLRAAQAANRADQLRLKKVGLYFASMIPLLVLSVYQLYSSQKVSGRELASMTIFFGAVLTLSGAGIAARYFGSVLPRQRKIDSLLTELADDAEY